LPISRMCLPLLAGCYTGVGGQQYAFHLANARTQIEAGFARS